MKSHYSPLKIGVVLLKRIPVPRSRIGGNILDKGAAYLDTLKDSLSSEKVVDTSILFLGDKQARQQMGNEAKAGVLSIICSVFW